MSELNPQIINYLIMLNHESITTVYYYISYDTNVLDMKVTNLKIFYPRDLASYLCKEAEIFLKHYILL